MEELLNNEQFKAILPYVPYLAIAAFVRLFFQVSLAVSARSCLLMIKKENQNILPNQVWFILVPFFNIYWNYVLVRRLTDSFINEFHDRQVAVEENPSLRLGYFFVISYIAYNFPLPMFVSLVAFVIGLIALVLYWQKIREYRNLLQQTHTGNNSNDSIA